MDTQYTLTRGSPDEVRAEAIEQILKLGRDGGYIAGPENWPPFPVQNAKAFSETMSKYGRYPLRQNLEALNRTGEESR